MLLNRRCKSIKRLLVDYLDNSLNEKDSQKVQIHLIKCHECEAYCDDIKGVLDNVRLIKEPQLPDSFWDNYVHNFRKRLEEESTLESNTLPEYHPVPWQLRLPRLAGSIALLILLIGIAFNIYLPTKKYVSLKTALLNEAIEAEYLSPLDEIDINSQVKEYLAMNITNEMSDIIGTFYDNGDIVILLDGLSEEESDILKNNILESLWGQRVESLKGLKS